MNLRELFCGLSDDEFERLAKAVQFGLVSIPIVVESIEKQEKTKGAGE